MTLLSLASVHIQTGPLDNIAKLLNFCIKQAHRSMQDKSGFVGLVEYIVANTTPW